MMKNIRAVIVEDEPKSLKILTSMLAEHCSFIRVVDTAGTVQAALESIELHDPDLVFLDIELAKGTGFELLNQIENPRFHLLFTTAFPTYAVDAIRHNAVDYLLKPIGIDELKAAAHKVEQRIASGEKLDMRILQELITKNIPRIALPTLEGLLFVKPEEIIRCEANGNYTSFVLVGQGKVLVSKNIKEFEELLENYHFCRVHHSHIVNLEYVRKYIKGRGGYLVLSDGSTIEVSIRKRDKFLQLFS